MICFVSCVRPGWTLYDVCDDGSESREVADSDRLSGNDSGISGDLQEFEQPNVAVRIH